MREVMLKAGRPLCFLLLISLASNCLADDVKTSREREALRRSQAVLKQTQQEKADLERQKEEATAKLSTTQAELDKLKKNGAQSEKRASSLERAMGTATTENKELRAKVAAAEKTIADLTAAQRSLEQSTAESQKLSDAERQSLNGKLVAQEERNLTCEKKNGQLAGIAFEFMDRYEKKGVWSAIKGSEPITGLKSVETENLLQEYRERVVDNTIRKNDKGAGAQK